jgi:hypothetical protein
MHATKSFDITYLSNGNMSSATTSASSLSARQNAIGTLLLPFALITVGLWIAILVHAAHQP